MPGAVPRRLKSRLCRSALRPWPMRSARRWLDRVDTVHAGTGQGGCALHFPHLKALRPFLTQGDFAPGSFGQDLVDILKPADLAVEKVAYSAFYMSRLEWVLNRAGIRDLMIAGIVTNGGVASTARDAHVRDFHVTILSDGCAAFSPAVHEENLAGLRSVGRQITCAEALAEIGAAR